MYLVIETQEQFLQSLQDIHSYLDGMRDIKEKERLALDTETCLCEEAREYYDLQYSLKKQKKKDKEKGVLPELKCPDYPIPHPRMGPMGVVEGQIRLIQLGLDPKFCNSQYIFDCFKLYDDWKLNVYESDIIPLEEFYKDLGALLSPLMERASILGQNLKYEYEFFDSLLGIELQEMRDLYLMSKIRWNGDASKDHGLGDLYEMNIPEDIFLKYTGKTHSEYKKFKKEEQKSPWYELDLTENQYQYAGEDVGPCVWYCFDAIYESCKQWGKAHDTGAPNTGIFQVIKDECELIGVIATAENVGVPFNKKTYLDKVRPLYQAKLQEAQDAINSMSMRKKIVKKKKTIGKGKEKQIIHWEEEVIEPHKITYYRDIREITGLDESALEKTSADDLFFFRDHHPSIPWIIQAKKYQKLTGYFESTGANSSSYLKTLDANGFIHPSIWQIGTDSSRMAQTRPNLTQVPRDPEVRECFEAPPGKKLAIRDYGQFEPRITAILTKDQFYMDCFLQDKDMHWETTKYLYGLEGDYDKKNPIQNKKRYECKTIRLAKTYLMGLSKFMKTLFIDTEGELDFILRGEEGLAEAKTLSESFNELSPGVTSYIKESVEPAVRSLATSCRGLGAFKNGKPFYVSKGLRGHTRIFCLKPEEKANAKSDYESWGIHYKIWDERFQRDSSYGNKCNKKLRDTVREAFNNEIQCTQAEAFKIGILYFWRRIKKMEREGAIKRRSCVMINFIHDEVIALVDEDIAEMMDGIMTEELIRGAQEVIGTEIPLKVDGGVMSTWAEKA